MLPGRNPRLLQLVTLAVCLLPVGSVWHCAVVGFSAVDLQPDCVPVVWLFVLACLWEGMGGVSNTPDV